jgi:hypothetical protein
MSESERLQRYRRECELEWVDENDEILANRILLLLNDPKIDKYCMVDAYYYDFSVIPDKIQEKFNFYRDVYLIYGISEDGEIISKWVERYDLDSSDPIVDGECIHPPYDPNQDNSIPPQIMQSFSANLLSTPAPDFIKMFGKND